MKVAIIGNCQTQPLRMLIKALHGDVQSKVLPSVYTMTPQHETFVTTEMADADWVVAQFITDEYPVAYVRSSTLRQQLGERLIVWPNAYFNGYAPEYHTIRDTEYGNFAGPLAEYHNEKIILGFCLGLTVPQTVRLLAVPSPLDEAWYDGAVPQSLQNLKMREKHTDVIISDFIEENFVARRLFYIMNHPCVEVLQKLAEKILTLMGVTYVADVPRRLFRDQELVNPFYPDNAFMRQRHGFRFAKTRLYRGVSLIPNDTPLGQKPDGPKIYTETAMVEAMFAFYEPHRARLAAHPRVRAILNRARPVLPDC